MSKGPLFDKDALERIPRQDIDRVLSKINWLWTNRREVVHHPLTGDLKPFFKRRLGNYRIVYTYDDAEDELVVRLVGTRDEIYKEAAKGLPGD